MQGLWITEYLEYKLNSKWISEHASFKMNNLFAYVPTQLSCFESVEEHYMNDIYYDLLLSRLYIATILYLKLSSDYWSDTIEQSMLKAFFLFGFVFFPEKFAMHLKDSFVLLFSIHKTNPYY